MTLEGHYDFYLAARGALSLGVRVVLERWGTSYTRFTFEPHGGRKGMSGKALSCEPRLSILAEGGARHFPLEINQIRLACERTLVPIFLNRLPA